MLKIGVPTMPNHTFLALLLGDFLVADTEPLEAELLVGKLGINQPTLELSSMMFNDCDICSY
jgi:hypothetical protein